MNKGWVSQQCCDSVCKECARQLVTDKESARKYCWDNNRVWSERMWEIAKNKTAPLLANNEEWLSKKTSQKKKDEIEQKYMVASFFSAINNQAVYRYVENEDETGRRPYIPESTVGTMMESDKAREDEEMVWSDEWGGLYQRRELRYLNDYYARLQDEFVLDNVNREDYARRVAMASLDANNKYQKMRQGTGTAEDWQKAQSVFDTMSKSASFAESQRKEVANTSMNALSTIIMDIELNHHNECPKVKFEKDDIDLILRDFGFTGEAIS